MTFCVHADVSVSFGRYFTFALSSDYSGAQPNCEKVQEAHSPSSNTNAPTIQSSLPFSATHLFYRSICVYLLYCSPPLNSSLSSSSLLTPPLANLITSSFSPTFCSFFLFVISIAQIGLPVEWKHPR